MLRFFGADMLLSLGLVCGLLDLVGDDGYKKI